MAGSTKSSLCTQLATLLRFENAMRFFHIFSANERKRGSVVPIFPLLSGG